MYGWFFGPRPYGRRWHHRWSADEDVNYVPIPVDVREEGENYRVRTILPGVNPEDIKLRVEGSTLTIRGTVRPEEGTGEYLLREMIAGPFGRTLTFPTPLDPEAVDAVMDQGMVTITLSKTASARAKTIPVKEKEGAK